MDGSDDETGKPALGHGGHEALMRIPGGRDHAFGRNANDALDEGQLVRA